jgi:hypothetical protein
MVLIAWNSSRSLSTSRTILLWPILWIKSTFISAHILCHRNGLALTRACVPKYFKDTLSVYTLVLCTPTSFATSPSNVLFQRFFSLMNWLSPLTTIELHALINNGHPTCINNPPMAKWFAPVYISKYLSNFANLNTGGENNLFLSPPKVWWQSSSHSWDSHFFPTSRVRL